jgi:hypothetical protein
MLLQFGRLDRLRELHEDGFVTSRLVRPFAGKRGDQAGPYGRKFEGILGSQYATVNRSDPSWNGHDESARARQFSLGLKEKSVRANPAKVPENGAAFGGGYVDRG